MKKWIQCFFCLGLTLFSGCLPWKKEQTMEQTVIIFKPDAMQQGRVGAILQRFENAHFRIVGIKMVQLNEPILRDHYSHLADKPFFGEIVDFMSSTPVIITVLEGEDAVAKVRDMTGVTDSKAAAKGTIRGDFGKDKSQNMIHASDSVDGAKAEVARFFKVSEIFPTK
jgi:nucleoside-diphosphate kinase